MHQLNRHLGFSLLAGGLGLALLLAGTGCITMDPPPPAKQHYRDVGVRPGTPEFLKGTIFERVDVSNTGPLPVTSYGLVVNLRHSGDSRAPQPVREWMVKEMMRHGIGSVRVPEFKNISPEAMLSDRRNAIVMVGAYLPPGARRDQRVDVVIQALPGSDTASLAGGMLYQCDLRLLGANALNPGAAVNTVIQARGPIFVNPAFALETPQSLDGRGKMASRMGTLLGGGRVNVDRAIHLRLRTPQGSISRAIEAVINQRFQGDADVVRKDGRGDCLAESVDEGYVHLYVPRRYNGDWEHFLGVVNHLYINMTPAMAAIKAEELAREARKPNALLENISYAFEGLGAVALPAITSLLNDASPAVQFAAARAGSYLGNTVSENALIKIASTREHPFRTSAIRELGFLPANAEINRTLIACLDASESMTRIEAYHSLIRVSDPRLPSPIYSKLIREQFMLDVVDSKGPPMVYATRVGEPRLVVFGPKMKVNEILTFSAFDMRLTIANHVSKPEVLSIFYRGEEMHRPVDCSSGRYVAELVARLGGESADGMQFGYGEVVAMLQSMSASGKLSAPFVLQDLAGVDQQFGDLSGNFVGRPTGEPATVEPVVNPATPQQAGTSGGPGGATGTGSPQPRPN